MEGKTRIDICKENFYYFNYFIKSKEDKLEKNIRSSFPFFDFLEEGSLQNIFTLYNEFDDDKIFLIEEQQRQMGFSHFCCYLSYYNCFAKSSQVYYVTDAKQIKSTVKIILSFADLFRDLFKLDVTYIDIRKTLEFSNGSKIRLYSDITYEFTERLRSAELLIFDNACMKNFDKLVLTIELLISQFVAKKAIINFNNMPPLFVTSENFQLLIKEFKNNLVIKKINKNE